MLILRWGIGRKPGMEKMKLVTEELDEGDGAGYAEGAQYGPSHPPSWFRVEWP